MQQILFDTNPFLSIRTQRFAKMPLGKLHSVLPIKELTDLLPKPKKIGANGWFDHERKIALQFLKHHTKLNDKTLWLRLNTD